MPCIIQRESVDTVFVKQKPAMIFSDMIRKVFTRSSVDGIFEINNRELVFSIEKFLIFEHAEMQIVFNATPPQYVFVR